MWYVGKFDEATRQFFNFLGLARETSHDETNAVVARTTLKAVHMGTSARKSCAFAEPVVLMATAHVKGQGR